ncbi:transcriptional regulator [Candidatus Curtissbacteria bacterium RIFCSPLOWO2_01_FULL_37_9]|uniref:Transcriptional regulator n=1 Tax=Candidatus Curtissbacteria bacterium RIFCSPLOWO2_01_FULL_37_9 TaxID=1797724 RepID=A0A1F5GVS7_9BACT|nr:MAG: transcriptional regulator [Candidatus Curtissbacteria bacterium RIFCSPLOWO2_01_FULL_37_9]
MTDWKVLKKELLKDPKVKAEYDKLQPKFAAVSALIEARIKKGLTQEALAKKIKTKQSAIARIESGNANPSIGFLQKLAEALGKKLVIQFK